MINYQNDLRYTLNNVKNNSSEEQDLEKVQLTIDVIEKYINSLLVLGYIDYVNFNSIISYLSNVELTFSEQDINTGKLFIDYTIKNENTIINICQQIGELLLNKFHQEMIDKFSIISSSRGSSSIEDIKDGFYCLNKAMSYELAYQVYEYQMKESRNHRVISSPTIFNHNIDSTWYKDSEIEEATKLFCAILYKTYKDEGLPYMSKKAFDKFLIPQILHTRAENLDVYLSNLGMVMKATEDIDKYGKKANLGVLVLEGVYQDIKILPKTH